MSWRDLALTLGGIVVGMSYAIACGSGGAAPPAGATSVDTGTGTTVDTSATGTTVPTTSSLTTPQTIVRARAVVSVSTIDQDGDSRYDASDEVSSILQGGGNPCPPGFTIVNWEGASSFDEPYSSVLCLEDV